MALTEHLLTHGEEQGVKMVAGGWLEPIQVLCSYTPPWDLVCVICCYGMGPPHSDPPTPPGLTYPRQTPGFGCS